MAESVVGLLLENINHLLIEETSVFLEVGEEIEVIYMELRMIRVLLKRLDAGKVKGESIRYWLREIKTLCYEINDVLDYYITKVQSKNGKGIRLSSVRVLTCWGDYRSAVHKVKSQINRIGGRLHDLSEVVKGFTITTEVQDSEASVPNFEGKPWWTQINVPVSIDDFVGMEKDINTLVSLLVNEGGNHPVISLFGMRGSGKTALAKTLFNHRRVREHLEGFAWIQLTQTFHADTVFQHILKQLPCVEDAVHKEDMGSAQRLYKVLKEKKCLVILDDIRSSDAWEILRIAFPFEETATSKIMLTTRSTKVVETVDGLGHIHTMKPLSDEEGWQLFKRRAFLTDGPDLQVPQSRKLIGKGLVRRCRGLPLTINMLGALLASMKTLREWEMVCQVIDLHVNIGEIAAIPRVLALSFIDVPSELRPCFHYLGYFPEESEIEVEKLYLLWMAEGIISSRSEREQSKGSEREQSKMDIAEDYLEKLREICLVEVQEDVTSLRKFKSCRIDGLMRELCLLMANEENYFVVIRAGQRIPDSFSSFPTTRLRRLLVYLDKSGCSVPFKREAAEYLKVLLVYNTHENQKGSVLPEEISDFRQVRVLRVLDFDGVDFQGMKLPRGLSRLELLRYLSFKGCFLMELPEAVGRLPNLEILDLRVKSEITLPNVLWNLKGLRYLYLPQKFQTLAGKLRLDSLEALETLENFSTKMCNVKHLQKLVNLRYLTAISEASEQEIKGLIDRLKLTTNTMLYSSIDVRNFDCYTEERHSVFRQLMACDALHTFSIEGQIRQIPPFENISRSLTEIVLSGSGLEEDPMPAFGKLLYLRVLVLNDDAFLGEDMLTASGFPQLMWLKLSNLCSLKNWRIEDGALAKLSTLTFESCRRLETLPKGLDSLTSLATLNFRKMPQAFQQGISAWKEKNQEVSINEY